MVELATVNANSIRTVFSWCCKTIVKIGHRENTKSRVP